MNRLISICCVLLGLALASTTVQANYTVHFVRNAAWAPINSEESMQIAEAQIYANVTALGGTQVLFEFHNYGPDQSVVKSIHSRDGGLIDFAYLIDSDENGGDSNVNFEQLGQLNGPPQGGGGWASFFATDADGTPPIWGINNGDPGDVLGIVFDLVGGQTIVHVETALENHDLEFAIHVVAFENGESEWLINNGYIPAPGAILLGSIGVGLVGWLRRRRTL